MVERQAPPDDPRDQPAYTISEVAHYLTVPKMTVRYWSVGRGENKALIEAPAGSAIPTLLSFYNLTELHVLSAIRREYDVSMPKARQAIEYLIDKAQSRWDRKHPLISVQLATDGLDLFVEQYGQLINISRSGQISIREIMSSALQRIERDAGGAPIKLYPFIQAKLEKAPTHIMIDPRVSFGRPVLAGTGISTQIIAERYKAGEGIKELAEDYEREPVEIEEAIRCELQEAA